LPQDELVYQLTALEVQLIPIEKQITQSMSHLKTIQYFIGNQGTAIAQEVFKKVQLPYSFVTCVVFNSTLAPEL